jgi:hypothetical protein
MNDEIRSFTTVVWSSNSVLVERLSVYNEFLCLNNDTIRVFYSFSR